MGNGGFAYNRTGIGPRDQGNSAPAGPTEIYLDDQITSQYNGTMNPNAAEDDVVAVITIEGGTLPFGATVGNIKFVCGSPGSSVDLMVAPGAVFSPTVGETLTITATDDNGNPIVRTFTIGVDSLPADITLIPNTVNNDAGAGTPVGSLFTNGGKTPLTYTRIANTNYDVIGSSILRSASGTISPGTDNVTVKVTDAWGNFYQKVLDVDVLDNSAQQTIFYHTFIHRVSPDLPANSVTEWITVPIPDGKMDGADYPAFQLLDATPVPYSFQSGPITTFPSGSMSIFRACLRLPQAIVSPTSISGHLAGVTPYSPGTTLNVFTWSEALNTPGTFGDGDCLLLPLDGTWPLGLSDTGFVRVINGTLGTFRLYYTYKDYLNSTFEQIPRDAITGGTALKASYEVVLCKNNGTAPTPSTLSLSDLSPDIAIEIDCLPYIESGLVPTGDYAHSGTWVSLLADPSSVVTEVINGDAGVGYTVRSLFKQAGHSDEYRIWGEYNVHLGQDKDGHLAQVRIRPAVTQPPWNPPKPGSGSTAPSNTTSKRCLAFSGVRFMDGVTTLIDQANLIPPGMSQGLFHNAFPMYFYQNSFGNNGYARGGTTTTAILATTASTANNFYNGLTMNFIAGPGSVATVTVTGYVGATQTVTFTPAIGASPTTATAYMILGVGTAAFIAPDCQITYGIDGAGCYCAQPSSTGTTPTNLSSTGVYNISYLDQKHDGYPGDNPDIMTGVIESGATSTTVKLPPWAPTPDGIFVGTTGQIKYRNTTGSDRNEKTITGYNSTTKTITVSPAFSPTPSTGAGFRIYSSPGVAMFDFQTPVNNFAGASNVTIKNSNAGTGNLSLILHTVCCSFSGFFIQEGFTPERFTLPGVGSAPADLGKMLHIQYDRDTLRRSGKLFSYDFSFGADAGNSSADNIYTPNGTGPVKQGNAATGEYPYLGAIAEYAASWCINQSYVDWITNQVSGLVGMHMSLNTREWTTWEVQPVITNLSQGYQMSGPWTGLPTPNPTFRLDPGNTDCSPFTSPGASISGHGTPLYASTSFAALSNEHQPAFAMGGAVATGWTELYEIVKSQAQFGITNPGSGNTATVTTSTYFGANNRNKSINGVLYQGNAFCESQERNQAWDLAQMACYAAIAPDGGAQNYFRDELSVNATSLYVWLRDVVQPANSYAWNNGICLTSVNSDGSPMWEWSYIWWALAVALGGSKTASVITLVNQWWNWLRHVYGAIVVDGTPRGDYWAGTYHVVLRQGSSSSSPLAQHDYNTAQINAELTWTAGGLFSMYTSSSRITDLTLPVGDGGWVIFTGTAINADLGPTWSLFTPYYIVQATPIPGAIAGNIGTCYLSETAGGSPKTTVVREHTGRLDVVCWCTQPGTTRWVQGSKDELGYGPAMLGAIQALRSAGVAISDATMDSIVANMQTRRQTYINERSSVPAINVKWLTTNLNG